MSIVHYLDASPPVDSLLLACVNRQIGAVKVTIDKFKHFTGTVHFVNFKIVSKLIMFP